ncbi:MAG: tetratricopeptide repeat protein [Gammaproteobacteria bacterium]|jgi:tetratricopeptide (TPR) repeat protein
MKAILYVLCCALLIGSAASAADFNATLLELQHRWARANYETPERDQEKAFDELVADARKLVTENPQMAEPRIWLAIILSSDAGVNGGLGALGKVKEARDLLEEAARINPDALDGSIYTSLGSLYYQVPGWPIGFGDEEKAEEYLQKALSINPRGIDPNYFYGDFLLEEGNYAEAVKFLEKARAAPPRPNRPLADKGRQAEIAMKLQQARKKL